MQELPCSSTPARVESRISTVWFLICLAALLLHVAVQFWLYHQHVWWISADEAGRTLQAVVMKNGYAIVSDWPPLPRWQLITLFKWGWEDHFWTPRVLTWGYGLLAGIELMFFSWVVFGSRAVVFLTGLLAACYAPRAIISAVPLVEIQFFVWGCLGLTCVWLGFERRQPVWHLAAAAWWALACMVRYEGWFISAVLIGVLFLWTWRTRVPHGWIIIAAATVVLAIFPGYWSMYFKTQRGDWLGFIRSPISEYALSQTTWRDNLWQSVLGQLPASNWRQLNLLGLVGLAAVAWRRSSMRWWILVPGGGFLVTGFLGAMGKAMPSHNFWRVASFWGMLLIPFTAAFVLGETPLRLPWLSCRLRRWVGSVAALSLLLLFAHDLKAQARDFVSPPDLIKTGQMVSAILRSGTVQDGRIRALIENSADWKFVNIMLVGGDANAFLDAGSLGDAALPPSPDQRAAWLNQMHLHGLRLLVYCDHQAKRNLDAYPELVRLKHSGDWAVYYLIK